MSSRRDFLKCSALLGTAASVVAMVPLTSSVVHGDEVAVASAYPSNAKDTYTVAMPLIERRATPRSIVIPDVEGMKVLKGDFHIHTLFSDGLVMPKDRIIEAVNNGLDVISITDHIEYRPYFGGSSRSRWLLTDKQANDFNLSYAIAKPEAETRNLLLVRGTEITKGAMPPGHFNALFAEDINPIAAAVDDWRKMLQVAVDQGAFILWNHPGWQSSYGGLKPGEPLRFTDQHESVYKKGLLHGVEVFNGTEHYPVVGDWCNERNLALIANSDVHKAEWDTYGNHNLLRPITLVLAKERTVQSVREAFFDRRTIGWAANLLWGREPWLPALFKASVAIKAVMPGVLELKNKSSLPCTVRAGGFTFDLPMDSPRQIFRAEGLKTLTVTNWMVGMDRPLEITLEV